MAKKGSFSKVYDKNGDYVDVEAARFDGTRTFQMQGDVSATQTWNGDSASALTLNTSIGAKKVTTDKINDKAVQTGQIDDGAVGLTQIATNAMNGTVQDNDSKLATHAAVKTYVDSQISGQGTYLGKHTVAEINAMVTDNLHNGDRVMTSDSGTINLGPGGVGFDVEAGEDLILYKSGSTVQWDSMDGNFKTKQTAVSDPTASGTGLTFIDSASQDENGEMTLSKKTVQDGTTSQKGVVQLEDSHSSTSTTKAATPKNVKEAYDLANTANTGAVKNVAYDSTNKKITKTINGTTSDVVSVATLKTDMALNNVDNTSDANKPVSTAQQAALDLKLDKTGDGKDVTATFTEASTRANIGTGEKLSVIFGKIKKWFSDLGTAAFKNVPASGNASSTEVVLGSDTRLSAGASAVQDVTVDGASVVNLSTKVAAVPNASTSAKGAVQLAGSIGATVASENNKAATEKAVRDAINALDAEVTSNDGTNVQVKVTEADGKISAVNVTTDNTENRNNKVSAWQTTPDDTHYPSEKLVKDGLDAKADSNNVVAIADAKVYRSGQSGGGWYKIAECSLNKGTRNISASWDVLAVNQAYSNSGKIALNYRYENSTGTFSRTNVRLDVDSWNATRNSIKVSHQLTTDKIIVEIWVNSADTYSGFAISERNSDNYSVDDVKGIWTYTSYSGNGGSSAPVTDATNNVVVTDVEIVYRQHNIASPTNNNLVAMDANGLVKDSGLTKSSVESAITSAGSAIQGVKVNSTTLTPDANKVVTVPLATTSADGAMSAADKTKLDNAATYTQSSGTAPVKVDASGSLTPVPMDCTPTASSTNLMTSGDIKTALDGKVDNSDIAKMVQVETAGTAAGSSLQPVYVNSSGVATAINYQKWNSTRTDRLNALPSDWYKSEGSISISSGTTVQYVELSGLNSIGGMDLWVMCNASNSPFMIRVRFNLFRYGRSGIQILDRSGYDIANIGSVIIRTDSNASGNPIFDNVKIYFRILNSSGTFAWRCSEALTNNHFAVLTEAQYNALTSVVACSANCTRFGATSVSSRHIQRSSYDVLDTGDVAQSYSSSSTAPISGHGVSLALATSLTDVAYAANASGGGGNLNKTKNGSTTSVLAFMTTAEAHSLWTNAKAKANAS